MDQVEVVVVAQVVVAKGLVAAVEPEVDRLHILLTVDVLVVQVD